LTFQACLAKIECRKRKEERGKMESIEREKKNRKEKRGSGGLYAHLSPFFLFGQKSKNKK